MCALFSGLRLPNHIHGIIIIDDSQFIEVQSKNVQRRDVQLNVSTRISPKKGISH